MGYTVSGDVETRETAETGKNEEGQEEVVNGSAEADSEGAGGGRDAEGDLLLIVSRPSLSPLLRIR